MNMTPFGQLARHCIDKINKSVPEGSEAAHGSVQQSVDSFLKLSAACQEPMPERILSQCKDDFEAVGALTTMQVFLHRDSISCYPNLQEAAVEALEGLRKSPLMNQATPEQKAAFSRGAVVSMRDWAGHEGLEGGLLNSPASDLAKLHHFHDHTASVARPEIAKLATHGDEISLADVAQIGDVCNSYAAFPKEAARYQVPRQIFQDLGQDPVGQQGAMLALSCTPISNAARKLAEHLDDPAFVRGGLVALARVADVEGVSEVRPAVAAGAAQADTLQFLQGIQEPYHRFWFD